MSVKESHTVFDSLSRESGKETVDEMHLRDRVFMAVTMRQAFGDHLKNYVDIVVRIIFVIHIELSLGLLVILYN